MTVAMIRMAARLVEEFGDDEIIDFHELGSEGAVLRTIVPGPFRGQGSWLIARNGDAQGWAGQLIRYRERSTA